MDKFNFSNLMSVMNSLIFKRLLIIFGIIGFIFLLMLLIFFSRRLTTLEATVIKLNTSTSERITTLEKLVSARELADSLIPKECTFDEGLGGSEDKPCWVEFHRILEAPQQFVGRWVVVTGKYVSGFEKSGLLSNSDELNQKMSLHRAIWINPLLEELKDNDEIHLVGKFNR
jgi:hypothetical protein